MKHKRDILEIAKQRWKGQEHSIIEEEGFFMYTGKNTAHLLIEALTKITQEKSLSFD